MYIHTFLIVIHHNNWHGHVLHLTLDHPTRIVLPDKAETVVWKRHCCWNYTKFMRLIVVDHQMLNVTLEDAVMLAWNCQEW